MRYFISQAGAETNNLTRFTEGTTFHLSRFNTTKNPIKPDRRNPYDYASSKKPGYADGEKLLNYVYGDKNGNSSPGDGWKYRGRGILQLTGRANYKDFNDFYRKHYDSSVDVLSQPELLNDDKSIGVINGLWYFKNRVLSHIDIDDKTSVEAVTKKINGGRNGIDERIRLYEKAQRDIRCH